GAALMRTNGSLGSAVVSGETPYLSVVTTARNDNHGGDLLYRIGVFVNGLVAQCDRHRIQAELVIVEWNPPTDRPRLADALAWPPLPRRPPRRSRDRGRGLADRPSARVLPRQRAADQRARRDAGSRQRLLLPDLPEAADAHPRLRVIRARAAAARHAVRDPGEGVRALAEPAGAH